MKIRLLLVASCLMAIMGCNDPTGPASNSGVTTGRYQHLAYVESQGGAAGTMTETYTLGPGGNFGSTISLEIGVVCEVRGRWTQTASTLSYSSLQSHCIADTLGNLGPWTYTDDTQIEVRNITPNSIELYQNRPQSILNTFIGLKNGWTHFDRIGD